MANKICEQEVIFNKMKEVSSKRSGLVSISKLTTEEIKQLTPIIEKINRHMKKNANQQPEDNSGTKTPKKPGRVERLIEDMTYILKRYENRGQYVIDTDINGVLNFLKNPDPASQNLKDLDQKFIKLESNLQFALLLTAFSRGRIYYTLRRTSQNFQLELAQFGIGKTTAYEYIKFYGLVTKYPRILVCEKSFTTILHNVKQIEKKCEEDYDFEALLAGRLIEVNTNNKMVDLSSIIKGMEYMDIDDENVVGVPIQTSC
jgi:hypothetical protein